MWARAWFRMDWAKLVPSHSKPLINLIRLLRPLGLLVVQMRTTYVCVESNSMRLEWHIILPQNWVFDKCVLLFFFSLSDVVEDLYVYFHFNCAHAESSCSMIYFKKHFSLVRFFSLVHIYIYNRKPYMWSIGIWSFPYKFFLIF